MAFKESTPVDPGGPELIGPFGLPHEWQLLQSKQCPRCRQLLEEFKHASRWTCYGCGIKIPNKTMRGSGRAYFIGPLKFQDELPF